jgi:DNA polymerase-1
MKETLYIIDGHAQIFAAYFAPFSAELTSPGGEPTKATYIFTNMLLKLINEQKPDKLVVAMDAKGPTFRHEMYEAYKANRPDCPEDLPIQIERIKEILAAMQITTCIKEGYEADDLIGTLALEGADKGYKVYICSRDKDLEQLIRDQVVLFNPKDGTITDAEALMEKKGIRPDQVVDTMALSGDTSDNIPGIPGVGSGFATKWIKEFGSLDNLLSDLSRIRGKRGESLRDNLDLLEISRKLVTIDTHVPMEFDWDNLAIKPLESKRVGGLFSQLGFTRLMSLLDLEFEAAVLAEVEAATLASENIQIELVNTLEAFDSFYLKLKQQKSFAIDTETTALNPVNAEMVGLSISWEKGVGYYLPFQVPLGQKALEKEETLEKLSPIFSDPKIKKSGQNIKYDLIILRQSGSQLAGVGFDTLIASFLLYPSHSSHSLDNLALNFLNYKTIHLEDLIGKGKKQITFDLVEPELAADYAGEDAEVTWRLTELFRDQFTDPDLKKLFDDVEMPLLEVLTQMEINGVCLNVAWLKKLSTQMSTRIDELVTQIHREAGRDFNVDSPKQLAEVLFGDLGFKPTKKGKTWPSTDQGVLESLSWQHPIASLMLEYRQLSKLKNTYVDKLPSMISPKTNRIHASFNQTVAATGRLSSSNPNLQNIPIRSELGQEIRRAFVAPSDEHVLLAADYSQIELRLLAHLSGDGGLRDAFVTGQDIHSFVASQVFNVALDQVDKDQRSNAKAVNFGIIYGQTPFGLSRSTGMSVGQAKTFIDDYFAHYPKIKTFIDETISQARIDGFVRTMLGRRRDLPEINSRNMNRRQMAERRAVNTIVQGSAADLIKVAMINIHRQIVADKMELKMILQVHDELVFELPKEKVESYSQFVEEKMTTAMDLTVPITVDLATAENWLECK